jgi:hypothetical protein
VESVTNNTKHYVDLFSEAVDKIMPKEGKEISYVISVHSGRSILTDIQIQR